MLLLPSPNYSSYHECYQCQKQFYGEPIDSYAFCSHECKNLYNGKVEVKGTGTTELTPQQLRAEAAMQQIRRRWRTLSGSQISRVVSTYFKTFHQPVVEVRQETTLEMAARTFDGGLF